MCFFCYGARLRSNKERRGNGHSVNSILVNITYYRLKLHSGDTCPTSWEVVLTLSCSFLTLFAPFFSQLLFLLRFSIHYIVYDSFPYLKVMSAFPCKHGEKKKKEYFL